MSALRHILGAIPATRRSYSSFSSSKFGGGRYLSAAKAKSAVVTAKSSNSGSKPDSSSPADSSSTSSSTANANAAAPQDGMSSSTNPTASTIADTQDPSPSVVAPPLLSPPTAAGPESYCAAQSLVTPVENSSLLHPVVSPKNFKLHQFFSLHRPLLLLHNSSSLFTQGPSLESVLSASRLKEAAAPQRLSSVFDDVQHTEAPIDADAEAARQLSRGLTLNKAGPAAEWEQTLKRLGLDLSRDPERVSMQVQLDKDWQDVQILLDSTKRKRRKKMKKHKLKKRRKATRASRLKLK